MSVARIPSYLASLVLFDKALVNTQWATPCWKTQHKWVGWCRGKVVYTVDNVTCDVGAGRLCIVSDDEPHLGFRT